MDELGVECRGAVDHEEAHPGPAGRGRRAVHRGRRSRSRTRRSPPRGHGCQQRAAGSPGHPSPVVVAHQRRVAAVVVDVVPDSDHGPRTGPRDEVGDRPLTVARRAEVPDHRLFFPVEQRYRAHLPQIHLHRIGDASHLRLVDFIQGLAVNIFRRLLPALRVRQRPFPVEIIHVHAVKQHHQVINLL